MPIQTNQLTKPAPGSAYWTSLYRELFDNSDEISGLGMYHEQYTRNPNKARTEARRSGYWNKHPYTE